MLDYETCRSILERDGDCFTKEEIEIISDFLWEMAEISTEQFLKEINPFYEEAGDFDGKG